MGSFHKDTLFVWPKSCRESDGKGRRRGQATAVDRGRPFVLTKSEKQLLEITPQLKFVGYDGNHNTLFDGKRKVEKEHG
jgi:hypothetical protein